MYVVSKTTQYLFIFDLDNMTWRRSSTNNGLFSNQPDQVNFITGGKGDTLYFTEDSGTNCGIHARKKDGRYLTILESNGSYYDSETTGLALSPDEKHMYFAFQGQGHVCDVTRNDGLPFDG